MADPLYQWGLDGAYISKGDGRSLAEAIQAVENEVCSYGSKYPGGTFYIMVSYDEGQSFDNLLLYNVETCRWRGEEAR